MRWIRYATADGPRWGILDGETVRELQGDPFGEWMAGPAVGPLSAVTLLAPVTPTKIICVGRNYPAHAAEHGAEVPPEPLLFFKPPSAIIGPGDSIVLPPQSRQVEYEAELAVVMGRRCRNVRPEEAWAYVLGITCANDVTARDLQRRDGQWTRAKGFDTFCPVGPWLVVGVSEAEVADRAVICRVNGQVRQHGRTSEMVFSPAALIAYAASVMTLEPGDLFLTGTPAGVGPIHPGDVVEVEVEGIGVLRNLVVAHS
ncbi:MAG: fumarylacetoacetate hydrolase family protein [Anaerolineae bacterium]|nr:fumarylacetoacetate hydrolase family protein [Anaerolineae bacterium]MDW8069219.1 fumarylacetoacetate hydrolase family protein [Anaerolineae bacterium]